MPIFEITSYRVNLFSPDSPQWAGMEAQITLTLRVPGEEAKYARLMFYAPGSAELSLGNDIAGSGIYYVRLRAGQYPAHVDLLRHEKPVRFIWTTNKAAWVTTDQEEVGEEEA